MCIICECNKSLTKTEFHECWTSNTHGAGFAWHKDGKNHYIKGFMDEDKAWAAYQDVPVPHVAHFRLASAGGVHADLTHPFIVSMESPISKEWDGAEPLIFHNGTISDWKQMLFSLSLRLGHLPPGEMSDTRVVAMAVGIMGESALNFFGYSKFAMIDSAGVIFRYGTWEKDGENWYTNSGYKTVRYSRAVYGYGGDDYGYGNGVTYWDKGDKDSDIALHLRNCLNCKMYCGVKESNAFNVPVKWGCKTKGDMHNTMKCAEWAEKRGPGRPKNKDKKSKMEREIPKQLAGVNGTATTVGQVALPFDRSIARGKYNCEGCSLYEGNMKCQKRAQPMNNLNRCADWVQSAEYPVTTTNLQGVKKEYHTCFDCVSYLGDMVCEKCPTRKMNNISVCAGFRKEVEVQTHFNGIM